MLTKTTSFKQQITINATPTELYTQIMDAKKHSKLTNSKVVIKDKMNTEFSVYDGYAYGKNVELIPNKKIVQTWRAHEDNWNGDILSEITFKFIPINEHKTKIVFTQKNIPDIVAEQFKKGWTNYYWKPLRRLFNQ